MKEMIAAAAWTVSAAARIASGARRSLVAGCWLLVTRRLLVATCWFAGCVRSSIGRLRIRSLARWVGRVQRPEQAVQKSTSFRASVRKLGCFRVGQVPQATRDFDTRFDFSLGTK